MGGIYFFSVFYFFFCLSLLCGIDHFIVILMKSDGLKCMRQPMGFVRLVRRRKEHNQKERKKLMAPI